MNLAEAFLHAQQVDVTESMHGSKPTSSVESFFFVIKAWYFCWFVKVLPYLSPSHGGIVVKSA